MPILPVLGHKPITSYFSWTSSAKRKRKESHFSTESSSKRPKPPASSCSSTSKLANTWTSRDEGQEATKGVHGYGHSSRDKRYSPYSLGNSSGQRSISDLLPTPPMICTAPSRFRAPEKKPPKSLDSPTCEEDDSELTIPSSQSQDTPCMAVDMFTNFSTISGGLSCPKTTEGENLIIESSQSQFLTIASPNMRKLELEPTLPALDVVIPSSQSQERELTIPAEENIGTGPRRSSLVYVTAC